MNQKRDHKWDNYDPERRSQVTAADKVAIAAFYQAESAKGRISLEIIQELADRYLKSDRQIHRYIQEVRNTSPVDAAQAERSGHWPSLRDLATNLSNSFFAPLPQILGMPWKYGLESNGSWTIDHNKGISEISLVAEENPLFPGLHSHLPEDHVWVHIASWKKSLTALADAPFAMETETDHDSLSRNGVVITPWIVKASLLEATEIEGVLPVNEFRLESNPDGGYVLRRYRNSSMWVNLATGSEAADLGGLDTLFLKLQTKFSKSPRMRGIQEQIAELKNYVGNISADFERIRLLAVFPGRCRLCS